MRGRQGEGGGGERERGFVACVDGCVFQSVHGAQSVTPAEEAETVPERRRQRRDGNRYFQRPPSPHSKDGSSLHGCLQPPSHPPSTRRPTPTARPRTRNEVMLCAINTSCSPLSLLLSLSQCDSEAERPLSLSFFQLFLSVSVGLFRVCLTCNQSLCCFLCTCLLSDALEARQALAVHAVVSFFLLCVCVVSLFACVFVCLGVRCFSAEGCVCTRVRYV